VEPEAGTVVATRYRILRPLGRGGMGEVWAAENIRTGRQVAVKLLRSESKAKSSAIERFRREARAAGSINSDHVTQVLDIDEDAEHGIAIVFELLEGESLIERLKRTGPMGFEELHPIIEQVWLGLADAHRAGIIHRDLKPSNVFLERRPDGVTRVKILDFGISKLPKELTGDTLTEMGQSLGTFSFMPPEQIGKAKTVDHRADIYATTTLIYQALSGQLPYEARNILLMVELKSKQEPRTLGAAMDGPVAPALEAFLAKGLARDPGARFQSAAEALAAWRDLAPAAVQSRPSTDRGRSASAPIDTAAAPSQPAPWSATAPMSNGPASPGRSDGAGAQRHPAHSAPGLATPASLRTTSPLGTRPTMLEAANPLRAPEAPSTNAPPESTTVPSIASPALIDPDTSDGIATIAIPYGGRLHRAAGGDRSTLEPPTLPRPGQSPSSPQTPAPQQVAAPPLASPSQVQPISQPQPMSQGGLPSLEPASQRAGNNGTIVMEYDARKGLVPAAHPNRPVAAPATYTPAPPAAHPTYDGARAAPTPYPAGYPSATPEPARPQSGRGLAPLVLGAIVFALVGFGLVALALRYFNL
jgi:serine/threonine-protein kinase